MTKIINPSALQQHVDDIMGHPARASAAPDLYTWLYSMSGAVTHGVRTDLGQDVAVCGYSPPIGWPWLGTGGQDEYEWAAELPQCRLCLKRLGRPLPPREQRRAGQG